MNKVIFLLSITLILSTTAQPALSAQPNLDLETRIAYQQGQFAALYDHCGTKEDRTLIGGSAANWKTKTFADYKGTTDERKQIEKSFDQAVKDVKQDPDACQEWNRQASATMNSIMQLVHFGAPVVLKDKTKLTQQITN